MAVVGDGDHVRYISNGFSIGGPRGAATVKLFRGWLPQLRAADGCFPPLPPRFLILVQLGDYSYHDFASVAYCRPRGAMPAVRLIPDTFFLGSSGYAALRDAVTAAALPAWEEREDVVFWRGSSTHNEVALDGGPVERIEQIPRVAMCMALGDRPDTDAAIMAPWPFLFSEEEQVERFTAAGIYRPGIPMIEHARYRYLIDIDGVACAWSFFEKLLLGCCILKVRSPFEQWFYHELAAWEHFVPVRHDLADLAERIEWCRRHDEAARAIAAAGQKFAMNLSYERARSVALKAVRDSALAL